jgi:anionic cell wall polymer biosynthesis LytR-Cps2A-Psr (LCP) family protein
VLARYRISGGQEYAISDYERIENQQALIKALADKLLTPGSLARVPEFINIFNENVHSNLKIENMVWFAEQLNKIRGSDSLSMHTMPTSGGSGPPMYYEYLDKEAVAALINETVNPYVDDISVDTLDIIGE